MLIPTAVGINTAGQRAGPSTTSWLLPLDLSQVSTIAPAATAGNITRQLTLADLGTDCPQTADPTAIATMVDSRCDPVLAAPAPVREWAYPCNACGRFGLFDPPYAVPTLTGGLVEPTVTETSGAVTVVTVVPPPTATATSTVVAQTPASTGAAAGSGAGAGSSGTGTGVTSAAGPGAGATASEVGSGSVGASASTAAPPATAAGARAGVGESVAGMWWVLGLSIVSVMFWL